MKPKILLLLVVTHLSVAFMGFSFGVYWLPIYIASTSPTESEISELSTKAQFTAQFKKDLKDSDLLHWGEGEVTVSPEFITLMGRLSPGPDYKLYLSPSYLETEAEFFRLKSTMVRVGDIKSFENFIVNVPPGIDPSKYSTVIIWCEAFDEFITSAQYREL